jgi:hypothetical protein
VARGGRGARTGRPVGGSRDHADRRLAAAESRTACSSKPRARSDGAR